MWCTQTYTYIAHMKHMAAPMNKAHTHTHVHTNTAHNTEPMASQAEKHLLKLMIAIASRHVMVSMSPTFLFLVCLVVWVSLAALVSLDCSPPLVWRPNFSRLHTRIQSKINSEKWEQQCQSSHCNTSHSSPYKHEQHTQSHRGIVCAYERPQLWLS